MVACISEAERTIGDSRVDKLGRGEVGQAILEGGVLGQTPQICF